MDCGVIREIPPYPGVYVLHILVDSDVTVNTRSRRFHIRPGHYIYVGSAKGAGGLRARLKRHLCGRGKAFWHIDYLLNQSSVSIVSIEYCVLVEKAIDMESVFSRLLREKYPAVEGFGCSDKKQDYSHLYRCGDRYEDCREVFESFRRLCKNLNETNIL